MIFWLSVLLVIDVMFSLQHPPGIRHKKFTAASIPAVVGGASSATARQLHMSALHTIYSHNPLPVSHHNLSMSPCPKTAVVELECITNNEGMTETLTVDTEPPHVDPRNEHLPATTVAPHASHQTKVSPCCTPTSVMWRCANFVDLLWLFVDQSVNMMI